VLFFCGKLIIHQKENDNKGVFIYHKFLTHPLLKAERLFLFSFGFLFYFLVFLFLLVFFGFL